MQCIHRAVAVRTGYAGLFSLLAALALLSIAASAAVPPGTSSPTPAQVRAQLAGISIPFMENVGQYDGRVKFAAPTFAGTLFVTATGEMIYALPAPIAGSDAADGDTTDGRQRPAPARGPTVALTETFVGGQPDPRAGVPHVTNVSRFVGNDPAQQHARIRTYSHVALGEVFPGIDVTLRATGNSVEKIFTVRPHQDPARIQVAIGGAKRLALAADGRLIAGMNAGDVVFTAPVAYQLRDGRQVPVPVAYALDAAQHRYGFTVGAYDAAEPLIIDPLLQATFVGSVSGFDVIKAITVHPVSGEVLVAGYTDSNVFPCTTAGGICANGAQPAYAGGNYDGFVARLNPNLTALLQATYLGGTAADYVFGITVHPVSGEVLVAGVTASTDLPCTIAGGVCGNGAQMAKAALNDGFVARLNANLTILLQATYMGGAGNDSIESIVVHPLNGEVLVAGASSSANLPCTTAGGGCANGAQPAYAGGTAQDGFAARFNANLTSLLQATYLGGSGTDLIHELVVHPVSGEVLVAGTTTSINLPCTTAGGNCANGAQTAHGGGVGGSFDGFIARLNAAMTILLQATYLGGINDDSVNGLTVHPQSGEILAAGYTASPNLPCTVAGGLCSAGAQSTFGGGSSDAFVARLNANLTDLLQASFIGGAGGEYAATIAVHPLTGEVLVGGNASATGLPCTTNGAGCGTGAQSAFAGGSGAGDGFVARLNPNLTRLLQATYLGGIDTDTIEALTVHPQSGEILVTGHTRSTDFPCTTAGGICANGAQSIHGGGGNDDGYIARLSPDLTLADTTPNPLTFAPKNGAPVSTLQISAPVQVTGIFGAVPVYVEGALGSAYCISLTSGCSCNASGGFLSVPGTINDNQFVCLQHLSAPVANQITQTVFHVGGGAGTFRVATGALLAACSLDVDGSNSIDALTDGLLMLRAMFGLTGTAVTNGAVAAGAPRANWTAIRAYLNGSCGTNFAP
ncbi:MAG: hypothetical protein ABIS68_03750 [Casimicrobiaceae bacterium]